MLHRSAIASIDRSQLRCDPYLGVFHRAETGAVAAPAADTV